MNLNTRIIGVLLLLFVVSLVHGQKTHKEIKKELRSLNNSAYIKRCFDGADDLIKQKNFDQALDLLNRAYNKGKSISDATAGVIIINKLEVIYKSMPRSDKYANEVQKTLQTLKGLDPNEELLNDVVQLGNNMKRSYATNPNREIAVLTNYFQSKILDLRQDKREENLEQKVNEFSQKSKYDSYAEFERLKNERQALQEMHNRLNETINNTEKKLNKHVAVINSMTRDRAKKEAVLQYNMRIVDSLSFLSQLDSINLINNEYIITQQASQISLQETELQLKESALQLKNSELKLRNSQRNLYLVLSLLGLISAGCLALFFWNAKRTNKELELKNEQIANEKERSEELLLNILPKFVAQELKENSRVETRLINQCTVLFTDFINFSSISKELSPHELIAALDECFRAFDAIISKYQIEKIKTIGDAYMCAGGVPVPNETHALDAVNAAKEMVEFLDKWNSERADQSLIRFDARIGIHTGPIIAGVVGMKKFAYDIWGDTVNVAARLESTSEAQKINISSTTYELIKNDYNCISRGDIKVKNMKKLEMYFVDEKTQVA